MRKDSGSITGRLSGIAADRREVERNEERGAEGERDAEGERGAEGEDEP